MTNVSALGQFMASPEDNKTEKNAHLPGSDSYRPFGAGSIKGAGYSKPMSIDPCLDVEFGSIRHDTEGYSAKTSTLVNGLGREAADFESFHNFDVVMSHTMSESDYRKAREDGFDPKDLEPSEAVTILDKVKTALLESGQVIDGFNDDLDVETLSKITGSSSLARDIEASFEHHDIPLTKDNIEDVLGALEKGALLSSAPKDESKNFLIDNNLDPSIDNLYLADHAVGGPRTGHSSYYMEGGYLNKIAQDDTYEDLDASILEVIEEAGFDTQDEDIKDMARQLLKDGLRLTTDTLQKKKDLEDLSFPLSKEKIIEAAAASIADGKKASEGNLIDPRSLVQKAVSLKKSLYLEEIRFEMSTEVNLRLLRSGIEIDTSYVEKSMEDIRNAQLQIAKALFPDRSDADKLYDLYRNTNEDIEAVKQSPAAVVGALTKEFKSATLEDIFNRSSIIKADYDKAQKTYEAVGTAVRADLGDSIKKAFRNVDELLKDMDLETNDDNRRAVRILSYNHTEVTRISVETVRSWDSKLVDTIDKLKPGAVLDMIREGRNPLKMTLDELSSYLSDKDKNPDERNEKFSRFLYKLEHSGQINDKEKESYIGIYRLFENLKATDHAAIGTVLMSGSEMTIGNLLGASRTLQRSKRGMDYKIDDEFGGLESGGFKSVSIDVQIETAFRYYAGKADRAYEHISPEKMLSFEDKGNDILEATLPEFADAMEESEGEDSKALEREYNQRQLQDIRDVLADELCSQSEEELKDSKIPVTVRNLEAMNELIASRIKYNTKNIWNQLRSRIKDKDDSTFEKSDEDSDDAIDKALDNLKNLSEYKNTIDNLSKTVETAMNTADTYIDIRAYKLLYTQLSIAGAMSDAGSYEVPVDMGSSKVSLHLSFRQGDGQSSRIEASIETENFGTVKADLSLSSSEDESGNNQNTIAPKVTGMLTTSAQGRSQTRRFMDNIKYIMTGDASSQDISIMYGAASRTGGSTKAAVSREADTTDKRLIKTAELFIKAVTDSLTMMEES